MANQEHLGQSKYLAWPKPSAHICHLFDSEKEQKETTLSFIKQGLINGEYCAHITTVHEPEQWDLALRSYGIDPEAEVQRGALDLFEARDWYSALNHDPVRMAGRLWGAIAKSQSIFTAVRLVSDMRWTREAGLSTDSLRSWEASSDLLLDGTESRVICQYDLGGTSDDLFAALTTHRIVMLKGRFYENAFYEANRIVSGEQRSDHLATNAESVREMLAMIQRQSDAA